MCMVTAAPRKGRLGTLVHLHHHPPDCSCCDAASCILHHATCACMYCKHAHSSGFMMVLLHLLQEEQTHVFMVDCCLLWHTLRPCRLAVSAATGWLAF